MSEIEIQAAFIAAVMRATGITEIRVTDEELMGRQRGTVVAYRDDMRDETVYRIVIPADVIDGEEVPTAAYELEAS